MLQIKQRHKKARLTHESHGKPSETRIDPDEPTSVAIQLALVQGAEWIQINVTLARAGDVEGVHHLRTSIRRLRSLLRLFHKEIDHSWSDGLESDLKWLGSELGAVRDIDVLRARFVKSADLAGLTSDLEPLFNALDARHRDKSEILTQALNSERFYALIRRLTDLPNAMPLNDSAADPCNELLPRLVEHAWRKLKNPARRLHESDADDAFHEVRKIAKMTRYAAEAVVNALDDETAAAATRFAQRAKAVQDVLGEHQDAIVATNEIRIIAAAHPDLGPFNFAAGRVLERELLAANQARDRFFAVWAKLDRNKYVRWMNR